MLLPRFTSIRNHSTQPKQAYWEISAENADRNGFVPITGYTSDEGAARDLMVHLRGYSVVTYAPESFVNGVVL